jgi:hypothetical protein
MGQARPAIQGSKRFLGLSRLRTAVLQAQSRAWTCLLGQSPFFWEFGKGGGESLERAVLPPESTATTNQLRALMRFEMALQSNAMPSTILGGFHETKRMPGGRNRRPYVPSSSAYPHPIPSQREPSPPSSMLLSSSASEQHAQIS